MFKKLYEKHSGSAARICSIQFLEHDLHIFALFLNVINCKAQPHRASLGYPFHNTAAHIEATPTREGI